MNKLVATFVGILMASCLTAFAAAPSTAPATATRPAASTKPAAPDPLPGKGLAEHDFFYTGEAKTHSMYIIRNGAVAWSYEDPKSTGEISDATLLSTGNILFAHQYGISLISPDKKILWHLDAPAQTEIHTAQMIGKDHVLYIQNGTEPKLVVVNISTGKNDKEMPLTVGNAKSTHGQFRHARLTDAGTVLIAHMDNKKVAEYDDAGKTVWSVDFPSPWAAARLKNGNTLISSTRLVREVSPKGDTVWEFTPANIPDYSFAGMQIATRLPSGNTLVNNWVNQWNGTIDEKSAPVQAWEVTPDKKVVWALRSWGLAGTPNLGPATTIQILDQASVPEEVHFGTIR